MLTLIAAVNKKGVIGKNGKLPWRDADDMYRFKELTKGKVCLVGRKTWENLPPSFFDGRTVIPISTDKSIGLSLLEAYLKFPDAWVIGGETVYRQAIESGYVKYYYLTIVDDDTDGDRFLPSLFY